MNDIELQDLMTDSANNAIAVTKEQFNITLDYSPQSIEKIDTAIIDYLGIFTSDALDDKGVFTICNIYGAYIGEVFRKTVGGVWIMDEQKANAPSVFISIKENQYAFAGICYQKLVNDSTVSVKHYFDLAVAAHTSPPQ